MKGYNKKINNAYKKYTSFYEFCLSGILTLK